MNIFMLIEIQLILLIFKKKIEKFRMFGLHQTMFFNYIFIFSETKKQGNTKADDVKNLTVYHNFSGNSIGGASLPNKSIQSVQFLRGLKSKTRPFVLNPKLSTSTSLPLYFFLGYQILQERKDLMADCGNVRRPLSVHLILLNGLK